MNIDGEEKYLECFQEINGGGWTLIADIDKRKIGGIVSSSNYLRFINFFIMEIFFNVLC